MTHSLLEKIFFSVGYRQGGWFGTLGWGWFIGMRYPRVVSNTGGTQQLCKTGIVTIPAGCYRDLGYSREALTVNFWLKNAQAAPGNSLSRAKMPIPVTFSR